MGQTLGFPPLAAKSLRKTVRYHGLRVRSAWKSESSSASRHGKPAILDAGLAGIVTNEEGLN